MSIASECTQTHDTSPLSCSNVSFAGCDFASDVYGLYFYLPSDDTVTLTGGAAGMHCSQSDVVAGGAIFASQFASINPHPNGNGPLELQIFSLSHEIAEYLTDSNAVTGWHCAIGQGSGTEVADLCEQQVCGGPWLGNVGGQPYNTVLGGVSYAISGVWQPGSVNSCLTQALTPTSLGALCPCPAPGGWQLACSGAFCTVPTCHDEQKDGFETDVDCGGNCTSLQVSGPLESPSSGLCASGKKCAYYTDCASGVCTSGACQ